MEQVNLALPLTPTDLRDIAALGSAEDLPVGISTIRTGLLECPARRFDDLVGSQMLESGSLEAQVEASAPAEQRECLQPVRSTLGHQVFDSEAWPVDLVDGCGALTSESSVFR